MRKIRKHVAVFLVMILALAAIPTVAIAAETDNEAVVIEDTEEERIAEVIDGNITYRSVYDKDANSITVYTIKQGEVVEYKVIDLAGPLVNEWVMPRGAIIQSQTGFGYSLGTNNTYAAPVTLKNEYVLDYAGINISPNVQSGYQQELRQHIETMIVQEGNLEIYLEAEDFLAVISIVQALCIDVSGAFSSAISAYSMTVQARVAAQTIYDQARFAAEKYKVLYAEVHPNEEYKFNLE